MPLSDEEQDSGPNAAKDDGSAKDRIDRVQSCIMIEVGSIVENVTTLNGRPEEEDQQQEQPSEFEQPIRHPRLSLSPFAVPAVKAAPDKQ